MTMHLFRMSNLLIDIQLAARLSSSLIRRRGLATTAQERVESIALVQGSSRGLGLEFVRQLLQRPGQRYFTFPQHLHQAFIICLAHLSLD